MKTLLLALFTTLTFVGCSVKKNESESKSDLSKLKLFGNVKTMKEVIYKATMVNGVAVKGEKRQDYGNFRNCTRVFDDRGNCVDYASFYPNDEFNYSRQYTFSEENLLIKSRGCYPVREDIIEIHSNGNPVESTASLEINCYDEAFYSYDHNRNLISEIRYDGAGNEIGWTKYSYDANNNLINKTYSNWYVDLYKYDSNNNCTEFRHNDSIRPESTYMVTHKYDKSNNEIEKTYSDHNSSSKTNMKYDENGNVVEYISYVEGIFRDEWKYKYDSNGNEIESIAKSSDSKPQHETRKYDDYGNLTEHKFYNEDGSVRGSTEYKYMYDQHDNWINIEISYNGKVREIIEREIEYFE